MKQKFDAIAQACLVLAGLNERVAQENMALVNLNAILLREICLAKMDPLDHFAQLEAELGGLGEAIAIEVSRVRDVPVSSLSITDTLEKVLRQGRDLLEHRLRADKGSNS